MKAIRFSLALAIFLLTGAFQLTTQAGATIKAADLVVVGFNSDNVATSTRAFALMALADIPIGSVIFLTDRGIYTSSTPPTFTDANADGTVKLAVTTAIPRGTIMHFLNNVGVNPYVAFNGTAYGTFSTTDTTAKRFNLSLDGDQILIYQTSNDTATGTIERVASGGGTEAGFVYAFNEDRDAGAGTVNDVDGWWLNPGSVTQLNAATQSRLPAGSTAVNSSDGTGNAATADAFGRLGSSASSVEFEDWAYTGPLTATTKAGWLTRIHTVANWTGNNSGVTFPTAGSYTVSLNTAPAVTAGGTLAYTENGSAAAIDTTITVSDSNGDNIASGTVTISSGFTSGDTLGFTTQNGISGSYNGSTGVLTLSGTTTAANYQTALRSVTYSSSSDTPAASSSSRTVTWVVTDANASPATSTGVTSTINITAVNDAPTDISLSSDTVSAFDGANSTVGSLFATDADDFSFTYSITAVKDPSNQNVSNANGTVFDLGSSGSASATGVAIATLRAVAPSSLSGGNYTLTVQADDGHGGTFSKDFTVTVSNSLVVDVTAIDGSAVNGAYSNDAADGAGLDLREALYYANSLSGNITIVFASTLSGTITLPGSLTVRDGVTFLMDSDTDSRSLTISSSSFALGGSLTVNVSSGDTLTIGSVLAGTGSTLTKSGAGTLTLSGSNTYTGTTTLNGGTLRLSGGSAIADTGAISVSSGTLVLGASETIGTLASTGGTLTLAGFTLTASGTSLDASGMDRSNADTGLLTTSNSGGATIKGTTGDDTITGGSGPDTIEGGDGNDTLSGGPGDSVADTLDGGAGDDVFVYTTHASLYNTTLNAFWDVIIGGAGTDTLRFQPTGTFTFGSALDWSAVSGVEKIVLTATGSNLNATLNANAYTEGLRTIDLSADTNPSGTDSVILSRITGGGLTVIGSSGADTLTGGSGADTFSGSDGNDTITGNDGDDILDGGNGNDTINGGNDNDVISGGAGTDTLTGGSGADEFKGSVSELTGDKIADLSVGDSVRLTGVTGLTAANIRISGSTLQIDTDATTFASPEVSITLTSVPTGVFIASTSGSDTLFTLTAPNTAPTLSNLNGDSVTWAGAGNAVVLDASANAVPADTELANNWAGASLTVQRSGTALSSDVFGFDTSGAMFSVSGGNLQIMGQTFATFTSSGGVLTVNFTSSVATATTSLVQNVIRRVTYRNDTPAGDATMTFTLSDGSLTATADVTVTSDYIYVTSTTDTATIDVTDGVSFSEAVAIAAADMTGTQTIVLASSLAGQTVSVSANPGISENLTLDADAASGATLSGGTITMNSFNTLTVSNGSGDTLVISAVLAGSNGNLTKSGAGALTLSGANTYGNTTTVSAGTLTANGGSALPNFGNVAVSSGATLALGAAETVGGLSGAGSVSLNSFTLTTGGSNLSTEFSGDISGTGGLTKTGTGTFTLSGANTYTGTTAVSAGTLQLNGGSAIVDTGAVTIAAGTSLTVGASETVGSVSGAGAITLSSGTLTLGGNNTSTTLSGVISGSGDLAKVGTGTLTLSGNNTYSGTTTISGGALSVSADSNIGSGTLTLDGGTLGISATAAIDNAVVLGAGGGTFDVANTIQTLTLSGVVSGSGALTKTGIGLFKLSGNNTYTGLTTVSAGYMIADHNNALGNTSTGTTVSSGGTLRINPGVTVAEPLTVAGLGSSGNGALQAVGGTSTVTSDITLTSDIRVSASGTLDLTGVISGSGGIDKRNTGILRLGGNNTYTGPVTLISGTVEVGHKNALGTDPTAISVPSGATLLLDGGISLTNALSIAGTGVSNKGALQVASGGAAANGNITMTADSAIGVWGTSLSIGGTISGAFDLSQDGTGILILAGNNTYTGATFLSATLKVTGTIGSVNAVLVNNGMTLTGTGTINGTVVVGTGGTVAPGTSATGALTMGGLFVSSGATLAVDINGTTPGTGYDQVIVNGTVDVTDATLSTTLGYTPAQGDVYTIIVNDGTDAITGTFSGLAEGGTKTLGAYDASASYLGGDGNDFTLALPPPNTPPTLSNLDGDSVAWAGVGNTVMLDASANAVPADTELGNNWSGASLTVQRSGTALSSDVFGFDTSGAMFSVSGGNLQIMGQTFATFTSSGGVLTVNFTSSTTTATTSLVQDVIRRVTYLNNTPAGDATIRFSLSDGTTPTTADVTVTSDYIYVTSTTDTATINVTDGVSFSEAVAIAAADNTGTQTIVLDSTLAGQTVSISSNPTIGESLTLDADMASGATLSGGTLTIGSGSTLTLSNGSSDNLAIGGVVAGAGKVTKTGSGTVTLTGTNTYSGDTTVSAGTFAVAGDSGIGDDSAVTVAAGATLTVDDTETIGSLAGAGSVVVSRALYAGTNNTSTTFSGEISGAGGFGKLGTGTLTLSGTNSYSVTAVWGGTLSITDDHNVGTGRIAFVSGSLKVTGSNVTIDNDIDLDTAAGTLETDEDGVEFSGVISGANGLTKTGSGVISLSGNNTYDGTTTVSQGTLRIKHNNALGTITGGTMVASGAALWVGDGLTVAEPLTISGSGVGSEGALYQATGTSTLDGDVALGAATTIGVGTDASASLTLGGTVSGAFALTKGGSGTLALSGMNSYSGTTTVSGGTLSLAGASSLGSGSLVMADATTLSVSVPAFLTQNITLNGGVTVQNGVNLLLSGTVSGSGSLTKTGAGTLTLGGNNTYSGATTVSAGTLSVAGDGNLGGGTLTLDGGTLDVSSSPFTKGIVLGPGGGTVNGGGGLTLSGVISGSGNFTRTGSGTLILSGNNTYSGTTTIGEGVLRISSDSNLGGGALIFSANTTLELLAPMTVDNAIVLNGAASVAVYGQSLTITLSGVISGTGGLTKTQDGSLLLTGDSTYSGVTTVTDGYLIAGHNHALGSTAGGTIVRDTGALRIGDGLTLGENLDLRSVGPLSDGGLQQLTGTGTVTGTVAISNAPKIAVAGNDLVLSGVVSGNSSQTFSKIGSGRLTMSGTNTYAGLITVSGGKLEVTGSLASSTAEVNVESGATLSGTGAIGGEVTTYNGATLAPGTIGAGTLSVGNLTMESGSTLAVDINGATAGTGYDQVNVTGTVDITGATLSTALGYTPTQGDVYTIIANDDTDAITGTFSGLAEGGTRVLGAYDALASYVGGDMNDFTLTPQVNATPTDITLSPASINLSAMSAGATIGTLTTTDAESGDMHTYSFATGTGDTDNGSFTLAGDTLKIGGSVLAKGTYAVRIKTDDGNGGTFEKALTVTVVDNIPPTVVSILRKTPATQLTKTTPVVYQVTFSEPVVNVATSTFAVAAVNGSSIVGSVTGVTGGPIVYDVTVNVTSGQGGFRLVVPAAGP